MTSADDLHALSGAYALNALDELERVRFERHLASCEACGREVGEFLETAALLGAAEYEAPPAGLRAAVLTEIAQTRQDRPATFSLPEVQLPSTSGWRDRVVLPAAAVLAILVIGLTAVVSNLNQRLGTIETSATGITDVVAAPDAEIHELVTTNGAAGRVVYSPTRGEAVLLASGMATAPDAHAYALWFLDDAGVPTAAGLFHTDGDGRVVHRISGNLTGVTALAVTIEPNTGSPQPTTAPVVQVQL